jgi:cation diffusion facilitator CzcD-associated flavoprotein CzcO
LLPYYASAQEIWQYLKDWAVHHDLERHVAFRHRVMGAKWNEEGGFWEVTIRKPSGEMMVDKGEILAHCHGVLKYVITLTFC